MSKSYGKKGNKRTQAKILFSQIQDLKQSKSLIDKIVKNFTDRSRKDIDTWREAIRKMEDPFFPNRVKYHAMAKDLAIDAHYHAQRLIRIQSSMSSKYRIVDDHGEERTKMTQLFERPWFRTAWREYLETKFTGNGLAEATKVYSGEIQELRVFPKDRIIPEKKEVLLHGYEMTGERYDDPEFENYIFEMGEVEDFGIMYKLAPLIIWKRNAQQAWSDFSQLFGMPLRVAKTNKKDAETLDLLEDMLSKMGEAGAAVFPMGTELEFVSATSTDSYKVYDMQIERCNSEISKGINGVTMLSDNGSSKSQADVHLKVNDYIVEADMNDWEAYVNFYLFPKLINLGYPLKGLRFEFDMSETLGKTEQWAMINEALDHYELDQEEVQKIIGVKIIGRKQAVATAAAASPPPPEEDGKDTVKNMLPKNIGHSVKNSGASDLHVHTGGCCVPQVSNASKGYLNEYETTFNNLLNAIFKKEAADMPLVAFQAVSNALTSAFKKGFKERLNGIDYNSPDNYKAAMYYANVFRFSAADTWDKVTKLNTLARESKNFDEFYSQAKNYVKATKSVLAVEFNNAETSSQNAANYLRQIEEADLFDLQYQTMGDSDVRSEHTALDGLVVSADDPILDTLYTPNGWECRCEWVQVPKNSLVKKQPPANYIDYVGKNFRYNPGKTNQLFDNAHSYFKEFPDEKTLSAKKWGLEKPSEIDFSKYSSFKTAITSKEEYREFWSNELSRLGKDTQDLVYKNFLGLNVRLPKDTLYEKFDTPKYVKEGRYSIIDKVGSILKDADEVWMQPNISRLKGISEYRTVYLKHYEGGTYVVITDTNEKQNNVLTWYKLEANKKKSIEQNYGDHRNGIIIKKASAK